MSSAERQRVYVGGIMVTRDVRSYFTSKNKKEKNSHIGILDLVKVTGNVTAADASTVNVKLESFSKKDRQTGLVIQY